MALQVSDTEIVDAMDRLWFCQNALFFEPKVVRLQSKLTTAKSLSSTWPSDDNKRPERLNIARGQPLFQLQSQATSKLRSHTSSPSMSGGSRPKSGKGKGRVRSYKSLSELENYELKGFMDLGFTFPRDKLSSNLTSMIPGLQRLEENDQGIDERRVRRPYLSEAWIFNRPSSPLINLRVLPRARDGPDMKKHIRFWVKKVAMLINDEP